VNGTPDCLPCLLRRALVAARRVTDDPWLHRKALCEAMGLLQKADLDRAPAELVWEVSQRLRKVLGSPDLFSEVKEGHRLEARAFEAKLRARVEGADDGWVEALRLSARANGLDGAALSAVSLGDIFGADEPPLGVDDAARVVESLRGAERIVFVADNAGELGIDRLLLEQLHAAGKALTIVVARDAVANDAVMADAEDANLSELGTVLESGGQSAGLSLALAPAEVRDRFEAADFVLAKGSAAYETLEGEAKPKAFLLRAKCAVIARHLGVSVGDAVVYAD